MGAILHLFFIILISVLSACGSRQESSLRLIENNGCLKDSYSIKAQGFSSTMSFPQKWILSQKENCQDHALNSKVILLKSQDELITAHKEVQENPCLLSISPFLKSKANSRVFAEDFFGDSEQNHLQALFDKDLTKLIEELQDSQNAHPIVAVIDTGVDIEHEDLKENIWINYGEYGKGKESNGIDDDGNGYIDDVHGYNFVYNLSDPSPTDEAAFHGTHVAGLIAARKDDQNGIQGLDSQAKIMVLNVFGSEEETSISYVDNAIVYAVNNGAQIINLSLGGQGFSRSTQNALNYAIAKNVFIVSATGNDSETLSNNPKNSNFNSPSSFAPFLDGMIAVSSIDLDGSLSSFANHSASVAELASIGSENSMWAKGLFSTFPDGLYGRSEGTSMAAPLVSALSSLMLRQNLMTKVQKLEQIMLSAARKEASLNKNIFKGRVMDVKETLLLNKAYNENEAIELAPLNSRSIAFDKFDPCL